MMLTSVSSISTIIASKSERAAENFMASGIVGGFAPSLFCTNCDATSPLDLESNLFSGASLYGCRQCSYVMFPLFSERSRCLVLPFHAGSVDDYGRAKL